MSIELDRPASAPVHGPPGVPLDVTYEGTGAGDVSTDRVSTEDLPNIHRVARLRPNAWWVDVRAITLDSGTGAEQIAGLCNRRG